MESAGCWGSYSVLGMGKARLAGRALVGGVQLSVSGWSMYPERMVYSFLIWHINYSSNERRIVSASIAIYGACA